MRLTRCATALVLALLTATTGCSKEASATHHREPTVMAPQIESMPGNPIAVLYCKSPQKFAERWFTHASQGELAPLVAEVRKSLRDPGRPGARALDELPGATTIALYGSPESPTSAGIFVTVAGVTPEQINGWLTRWFGATKPTETQVEGQAFTRYEANGTPVTTGMVRGQWVMTDSDDRLARFMRSEKGELPAGTNAAWKAVGSPDTQIFLSFDLRWIRGLPAIENNPEAQTGVAIAGLTGLQGGALCVDERSGRFVESFFLATPEPHGGALSLVAGPKIDVDTLKFPANATGVSVWSFDLEASWLAIGRQLPPEVRDQIEQVTEQIQLNVARDVLAPIGQRMVSFSLPSDNPLEPRQLFAIAIDDRAPLEKLLKQYGAQLPLEFETGAGGATILAMPSAGGPVPALALTDEQLVIATRRDDLESWIAGRHGEAPAEFRTFAKRFDDRATVLTWVGRETMQQIPETFSALPGGALSAPLPDVPGLDMVDEIPWFDLTRALGDVGFAVVPDSQGISFVAENSGGMVPFLIATGLARHHAGDAPPETSMTDLAPLAQTVAEAQRVHLAQAGRYATSLRELHRHDLIDADLADGLEGDCLYRVQGNGRSWHMDFKSESNGRNYRYDPEQGELELVQ